MTTKLIQKRLFKPTQEFEIVDDTVNILIKTPTKEEKLTVVLYILNPDPVINVPYLEFHSRVKCDPLISLYINKPNKEEFNAFVSTLRQRALEEYNAFSGMNSPDRTAGLAANVYEEPPEFEDSDEPRRKNVKKDIDVSEIDLTIEMLETYLGDEDLSPLVSALEALKADPTNEENLVQVADAFELLGPRQGAILTYAPYVGILLTDEAAW